MKGTDRNQPCPCGSGRKTKHCPGPHLAEIEAAYRENSDRDLEMRLARIPRRRSNALQALTLVSAMLDLPRGSR